MRVADQEYVDLLRLAAGKLTGHKRRVFVAEVAIRLCDGNARQSEERFGWGRETVCKGLQELEQGTAIVDNFKARGRTRSEERNPKLAEDIDIQLSIRHCKPTTLFKRSFWNGVYSNTRRR